MLGYQHSSASSWFVGCLEPLQQVASVFVECGHGGSDTCRSNSSLGLVNESSSGVLEVVMAGFSVVRQEALHYSNRRNV